MRYSKCGHGQEQEVSALVWDVFSKYEAPDYPEEGINTFKAFISPDNLHKMVVQNGLRIYCCFDENQMSGVLAVRDQSHIALLFVRTEYHHRGIAKNLIKMAWDELVSSNADTSTMTVNSSPYAVPIYERMGFTQLAEAIQEKDGLLFMPMTKNMGQAG